MEQHCEICGLPIWLLRFPLDVKREGIIWCDPCFKWILKIMGQGRGWNHALTVTVDR
jgi:hypothetical protein